ncbi:50S ribosomal protein L11 methyltransferase [Streptomyces lavendulocolor]|uniref:50S ribosomal protein L11 methyltransferase n=1 Tax=Streptomyces lavendulocolor TaxID=67316 RepID=UPI003C2F63E6
MHWRPLAETLATRAVHPTSRWRPWISALPRHTLVPRWWARTPHGWRLRDGRTDPSAWAATAYQDRSLVTRIGPLHADKAHSGDRPQGMPTSSATEPGLVVRMFQHARIEDGHQLLDVGTGSGYGTALAACRLGEERVTSIDVDPYVVEAARSRLGDLELRPRLDVVDATGPLPGVYDRIVATVGVRPVPAGWLEALKTGGRLVTTISGTSLIITADKRADGAAVGRVEWDRAGFMQARHDDDYAAALPDGLRHTALHGEGEAVTTGTYPVVDVQEGWDLASMLAVEAPGTVTGYRADGDERTTWLAHPDGSWARATSYGGQLPLVHQNGSRRLWDVLDRIRSYWLQHGELPLRGARVKITPDGHTVLARGSWRATL